MGIGQNDEELRSSNEDVFGTFEGEDTSVLVRGFINRKAVDLLIDTGAGPCVIDLRTLKKLNKSNCINYAEGGRQLHGLGDANVIGTVTLDVSLQSKLRRTQTFKVVKDLGGTILLGRKFLAKFGSLQINWRKMTLKIDDILIGGKDVIQGGSLNSRAYVANEEAPPEVSVEDQIKKK